MKILSVGAELFHADGRTDVHDKPIVAFGSFVKAPKQYNEIYFFLNNATPFVEPLYFSRM
jgi:hypothetical protein